jgi:hypothetical protein
VSPDLGDLMKERARVRASETGCSFEEALEYVKDWFFGKFLADKALVESESEEDP